MKMIRFLAVALACCTGVQSLYAAVGVGAGLFSRGKFRSTFYAASASAGDNQYLVAGLGLGYYIMDGLQAGVDGEGWFGNSPRIYKLAPQILYVFYDVQQLKPYCGVFCRRTFYENNPDLDSYGGRVGVVSAVNSHIYTSFGIVYEKYVDYDETKYASYSAVYPEFGITVSF